jgi:hypothetical protein
VHDDWIRFDEQTEALYAPWDTRKHPLCPLYPVDETEETWVYEYEFTTKERLIRSLRGFLFWGVVFIVGIVFIAGGVRMLYDISQDSDGRHRVVSLWVTIAIVSLGGALVWRNRSLFELEKVEGEQTRWTRDHLRGMVYWDEHGDVLQEQVSKAHMKELSRRVEEGQSQLF